jgi:hypothetical protein
MGDNALMYGIMGAGQIANAWGQYKVGKEANKLAREQLAYEKEKDVGFANKQAEAQAEFETGFDSVFNPKKKKTTDIATAYDTTTPSTTLSA